MGRFTHRTGWERVLLTKHIGNVKQDLKDVVQSLKDCKLQSAKLAVPCLGLGSTFESTSELDAGELAKRYRDHDTHGFGREVFDELATELGVSERNDCWDFAENVVA